MAYLDILLTRVIFNVAKPCIFVCALDLLTLSFIQHGFNKHLLSKRHCARDAEGRGNQHTGMGLHLPLTHNYSYFKSYNLYSPFVIYPLKYCGACPFLFIPTNYPDYSPYHGRYSQLTSLIFQWEKFLPIPPLCRWQLSFQNLNRIRSYFFIKKVCMTYSWNGHQFHSTTLECKKYHFS